MVGEGFDCMVGSFFSLLFLKWSELVFGVVESVGKMGEDESVAVI